MVKFSEDQIDSIAREIVSRLARSDEDTNQPEISSYTGELVKGIFPDINSAVEAVYVAQKKYMEIPLQERNKIISHIRKKMLEHGDELAREANAETGLGRYEDKVIKNKLVTEKTPGVEDLTTAASRCPEVILTMGMSYFRTTLARASRMSALTRPTGVLGTMA